MRKIVFGGAAMLALMTACQQQQQQQKPGASASAIHPGALDVTGPNSGATPVYKPSAVVPPEEPAIRPAPVVAAPKVTPTPVATAAPVHAKPASQHPTKSVPANATLASAKSGGGSYKVKKGDTLYAIARAEYGDGKQWKRIAAANPGLTPGKLKAGQTLTIPQ